MAPTAAQGPLQAPAPYASGEVREIVWRPHVTSPHRVHGDRPARSVLNANVQVEITLWPAVERKLVSGWLRSRSAISVREPGRIDCAFHHAPTIGETGVCPNGLSAWSDASHGSPLSYEGELRERPKARRSPNRAQTVAGPGRVRQRAERSRAPNVDGARGSIGRGVAFASRRVQSPRRRRRSRWITPGTPRSWSPGSILQRGSLLQLQRRNPVRS